LCEHGNEPSFPIKHEEFSWPAAEMLASHERLSSVELFVYVKSEFLSAVNMNNTVLWNVTPCNMAEFRRRFGVTYYLLLQCLRTTMKLEVLISSKPQRFYRITRCHIPKRRIYHTAIRSSLFRRL
jgi:hypothetical protein